MTEPKYMFCAGCGQRAARVVHDPGIAVGLPLCDECPSPTEIAAAAAEIREGWPRNEERKRRGLRPITVTETTWQVPTSECLRTAKRPELDE